MMIDNHEKHTLSLGQQPRDGLLRHEVESRLAGEVASLLRRNPAEGLSWRGSSKDLMEALHAAFTTGMIADDGGGDGDDDGTLSFRQMVRRACGVLHVSEPRNPYEAAARAKRRKGLRRTPFIERYRRSLNRPGATPFLDMIADSSD